MLRRVCYLGLFTCDQHLARVKTRVSSNAWSALSAQYAEQGLWSGTVSVRLSAPVWFSRVELTAETSTRPPTALLFLAVFSKHSSCRSTNICSALEALARMRYISPRFTVYYMDPQRQTRCCRFAAVGPAGRRYRSIVAAAAVECGQCHVVGVRS